LAARRAETLRLLGELTAGMAHDVRNVLNGLFLRVQLLERARGLRAGHVAETLAQMRNDVVVGVQLLERIRAFAAAANTSMFVPVDLNDALGEACDLAELHTSIGAAERVVVRREPSPSAVLVTGQRGELVSAVLNLVLNAMDATPPGGFVSVRSGQTDATGWIEVTDRGTGIPPEVEAHMFEPFFTTKGNAGTGLGLASVAACMHRHHGEVCVRTERGRGTNIVLSFPSAVHRGEGSAPAPC
jgi:signal transduction histidine kinase